MSRLADLLQYRSAPPLDVPFDINRASEQARNLELWVPIVGLNPIVPIFANYARGKWPGAIVGAPLVFPSTDWGRLVLLNGTTDAYAFGGIPVFQETTPFTVVTVFGSAGDVDGTICGMWNVGVTPGWFADTNAGRLRFLITNALGTGGRMAQTTATTYNNGATYHVVMTYAGNSSSAGILFYVDGQLVPSASIINTAPGTLVTNSFNVGATSSILSGWVGEVRLYSRALNASEVWALYAKQSRWDLYKPLIAA